MTTPARDITLIGCPLDKGAGRLGSSMGPAALRIAGLADALRELGHNVIDLGDVHPRMPEGAALPGNARNVADIVGWTHALEQRGFEAMEGGRLPIFLGGDHSLSMGSVSGIARYAAAAGRPLFVLWLDAHTDFNTPKTSPSGNMHGMPVAFFCGEAGFDGILPASRAMVKPGHVHMFGIRSIDDMERELVLARGVKVHDMRRIDEMGISRILREILDEVRAANGLLHVSVDADFLDPDIAPGVGTPVSGGATFREAHLAMELLHESGLVSSLDLVEVNPYLDNRGQTARLMVELTASLFGRKTLPYSGPSYSGL